MTRGLVMRRFYQRAGGRPEKLPWHRTSPGSILTAAAQGGRGRALDVGCGAGVFSVYLAQHDWQVTGIDVLDEAIAMARTRAADRGADVELLRTDLFAYAPPAPFHLVFDSGCLHSLIGGDVPRYKRRLLSWLAPGGEYVLEHWGKRHPLDWRPIGPRRRSAPAIEQLFAPELELIEAEAHDTSVPLPFGPKIRTTTYHFRAPS